MLKIRIPLSFIYDTVGKCQGFILSLFNLTSKNNVNFSSGLFAGVGFSVILNKFLGLLKYLIYLSVIKYDLPAGKYPLYNADGYKLHAS